MRDIKEEAINAGYLNAGYLTDCQVPEAWVRRGHPLHCYQVKLYFEGHVRTNPDNGSIVITHVVPSPINTINLKLTI